MIQLVFATNNKHKLEEVQQILGNTIKLLSLANIACNDEIPEDYDTLEENALQKARYIYLKYKINCFADDTGLEIDALNGKPGVFSARYSCDVVETTPNRGLANMQKVLLQMQDVTNRTAKFRTVIALIENGKETIFEGIINGEILFNQQGERGFGYDPIFKPIGHSISFAQMDMEQKNSISHRALAIQKLQTYLTNQLKPYNNL